MTPAEIVATWPVPTPAQVDLLRRLLGSRPAVTLDAAHNPQPAARRAA